MVASRNGREGLELDASQDGVGVLTPARLETPRGRLNTQDVCFVLRCAQVSRNGGVRSQEHGIVRARVNIGVRAC
eukprot:705067-Prymnesium_polylepis.1